MSNWAVRLRALLPTAPLLVGEVIAVDGGTLLVETPDGATWQVRGVASVGARVFFRDGVAESTAPSLPIETIEI